MNKTQESKFKAKYNQVAELCNGDLDNMAKTTLWDWMSSGLWETMTVEEIAAEWNELESQSND